MYRPSLAAIALISVLLANGPTRADEVHSATISGVVRDAAGKPLPGATVLINRSTDALPEGALPRVLTGPDGSFAMIVRYRGATPIVVREVWAEAPGYVRGQVARALRLGPGAAERLDFALAPGEILAGFVRPGESPGRKAGSDGRYILDVRGEGFQQYHRTEAGGRFEIYVPTGTYTIRCMGAAGSPAWDGLKSGRRDLNLEPRPVVLDPRKAGELFDLVWSALDRDYSYFTIKNGVDWAASKERYRPRALEAKDVSGLVAVLKEMLATLEDSHIWIETPNGIEATWMPRPRGRNWNRRVTLAALEEAGRVDCGFAIVGKTKGDGFGYFLMTRQGAADDAGVRAAIVAIEALRDAPGFVVDLRQAEGGDERKAQAIARLFCAADTVYARGKFRNGPAHDAFTKDFERVLRASPRPYTRPVVCLIGPGAVSSGEGFVKMMRALPQVKTVGRTTRGSSGNPKPVELPGTGVSVTFSRWVDMTPDGRSFEGIGLAPDVEVDLPERAHADSDPTLARGLEVLRDLVSRARERGK